MGISKQEALRMAELARLEMGEEEAGRYAVELMKILSYIEKLAAVDTEGKEPLTHAQEMVNVMREDVPQDGLSREEALMNAPSRRGEFFLVPKIMDNSEEG